MTSPLDSMHLYTKVLTGMVLLLNIGLLVSIRMALKFARRSTAIDKSEQGDRMWVSARRTLAVLILAVVGMNATAVFANYRMVNATRDIAAELPQNSDAEIALTMSR